MGWQSLFLEQIRKTGGFYRAAQVAGVHPATAYAWCHRDPGFQAAVKDARELHADQLEEELEDMGRNSRGKNPVPHIVRLKALRPQEYIERRLEASISVTATAQVTGDEAKALLQEMLESATPMTRAMLSRADEGAKRVLEVETDRREQPADPPGEGLRP